MKKPPGTDLGRKIGIASLIMMASILLSRVLGVVREAVIAYIGGAGPEVDAYNIAFQLPEILNHIVAGGYLSITFIPILAAHFERGDRAEGWRVLSVVATFFTTVLALLTIAAMAGAEDLITLVAPGTAERPEVLAQATRMTRIILPAQLCFFLGGLFMAVQYTQGRFLIPALAPLVYNTGIIAGGVLLGPRMGMEGFSWGVLGGAALGQLVLQAFGALRAGMRIRPSWQVRHPDFRRFVLLTLPLIFSLGMTFSMEFFFRFFGSMLKAGAVASLNYGLRVTMMLIGLFGTAAGVASYPFLARLVARGEHDRFLQVLNATLRRYVCLAIPASAIMIILAREMVVVLFQRGAFTPADTARTALVLQVFLAGAFATAGLFIVLRGFYAMRNTLVPAVYGTIAVGLSIPVYWVLAEQMGEAGVALGVAVSGLLQAIVLFTVFNRRTRNAGAPTYLALGRALLVSLPPAAAAWAVRAGLLQWLDAGRLAGALAVGACTAAVFAVLLLVLARVFHVSEIDDVVRAVRRRIGRSA